MKAIDVTIISNEIEASHRLEKKKKNVIVPVAKSENCLQELWNKKKVKSIDKNFVGKENLTAVNRTFAFNYQNWKVMAKLKNSTPSMEFSTS